MDDHLLPDRSPEPVLEVVDLVQDHELDPIETARTGIDHVAENLGRHDDDVGVAIDYVVAREESNLLGPVLVGQITELLVREGLDGSRVEDPLAVCQRFVDRRLGDERFPGTCGSRDHHGIAGVDHRDCFPLELVGFEWEGGEESLDRLAHRLRRVRRTSQ